MFLSFHYFLAGGHGISFHPLPNEDGGLRLWKRTCALGRPGHIDRLDRAAGDSYCSVHRRAVFCSIF